MADKGVVFDEPSAARIAAFVRRVDGPEQPLARRGWPLAHERFVAAVLTEALPHGGTATAIVVGSSREIDAVNLSGKAFADGDTILADWHQQSQTWLVDCNCGCPPFSVATVLDWVHFTRCTETSTWPTPNLDSLMVIAAFSFESGVSGCPVVHAYSYLCFYDSMDGDNAVFIRTPDTFRPDGITITLHVTEAGEIVYALAEDAGGTIVEATADEGDPPQMNATSIGACVTAITGAATRALKVWGEGTEPSAISLTFSLTTGELGDGFGDCECTVGEDEICLPVSATNLVDGYYLSVAGQVTCPDIPCIEGVELVRTASFSNASQACNDLASPTFDPPCDHTTGDPTWSGQVAITVAAQLSGGLGPAAGTATIVFEQPTGDPRDVDLGTLTIGCSGAFGLNPYDPGADYASECITAVTAVDITEGCTPVCDPPPDPEDCEDCDAINVDVEDCEHGHRIDAYLSGSWVGLGPIRCDEGYEAPDQPTCTPAEGCVVVQCCTPVEACEPGEEVEPGDFGECECCEFGCSLWTWTVTMMGGGSWATLSAGDFTPIQPARTGAFAGEEVYTCNGAP